MRHAANLVTALSLGCGFISVIFSLEGRFAFACWPIILSVILDGLDGQLARKYPAASEFGRELDSLVDLISFGAAPAILSYVFVYGGFYPGAVIVLFLYLLSSAVRLARYNLTPKEEAAEYFCGLPTIAAAGLLVSLVLIYRKYLRLPPLFIPAQRLSILSGIGPGVFRAVWGPVFSAIALLLAFLMVSKIKYPNLNSPRYFSPKKRGLFLAMALTALALSPPAVLFALFSGYLVFSPFLIRKFV